jgi:hypothetical protein
MTWVSSFFAAAGSAVARPGVRGCRLLSIRQIFEIRKITVTRKRWPATAAAANDAALPHIDAPAARDTSFAALGLHANVENFAKEMLS